MFEDDDDILPMRSSPTAKCVTESQRSAIRAAFLQLGIAGAKEKFAMVEELVGQRIASVGELESARARLLIHHLAAKVSSASKKNTGDTWADRDEETWIDRI